MSNNQRKKMAAAKHNVALDEVAALKEDRIRDPEKYAIDSKRNQQALSNKFNSMVVLTMISGLSIN